MRNTDGMIVGDLNCENPALKNLPPVIRQEVVDGY
jgi:hypothetical protein